MFPWQYIPFPMSSVELISERACRGLHSQWCKCSDGNESGLHDVRFQTWRHLPKCWLLCIFRKANCYASYPSLLSLLYSNLPVSSQFQLTRGSKTAQAKITGDKGHEVAENWENYSKTKWGSGQSTHEKVCSIIVSEQGTRVVQLWASKTVKHCVASTGLLKPFIVGELSLY